MPPILEIASWDAIETTKGDVVIVLPPIPRPRGVVVADDGVYVVTVASPIRLTSSMALRSVIMRGRMLVVAEAHEHIARETLVPVAYLAQQDDGARINDLQAA